MSAFKEKTNTEEEILVGTILLYPEKYPEAASIVRPSDFTNHQVMRVWAKIGEQYAKGADDLQSRVALAMGTNDELEWVINLSGNIIPVPSSVIGLARAIADSAKRRRLAAELKAIAGKATQPGMNADWILEDVMTAYRREAGEADMDVRIGPVVDRFKAVQARNIKAGKLGFRTGFDLLQRDFVVYQPGHMWVIGAWTSTGKTALMIEAVNRFFLENQEGHVAIFSTEMKEEQNVARLLANRTGINANVILSGEMLAGHAERVSREEAALRQRSLVIHDRLRNIDDIMAQCRKLKFTSGLDLVWIDFIQNVFRPNAGEQYAMMSQIAKDLQALAHDLSCTVVALSQLPNHAGREDTGILEFKGAGEIAAACDVGVLMKRAKEDNTKILFDVRKNRHGKCGKYILQFTDGWTRIEELETVN